MADKKFTSCGSSENLRDQFNALVDDMDAFRTAMATLLAQLDADAGVTDSDYATNCTPAAKTSGDLVDYDP